MKVYKEQTYIQSLIIQYDLIKTLILSFTQNNFNSLPTHTQTQIFLVFIDN